MRSLKSPKRKHATMACVSCRESKVKVVNTGPHHLKLDSELMSRSVMVDNRHVPLVSAETANAAIGILINESELHL